MQFGVIQHGQLGLLIEVVGDHGAIARFQCQQAALNCFAGKAEAANFTLALKFGQGFVHAAVTQNRHVVAV